MLLPGPAWPLWTHCTVSLSHPVSHSIPCCWATLQHPTLRQCHLASHMPHKAALHLMTPHTCPVGQWGTLAKRAE